MLRRAFTVALAALILGGSGVAAKDKKKDPAEGLPTDSKYGIAVDYRWRPSVTKYASLEGKVYNRSQNDYVSVNVIFHLYAKDGDRIEEYTFRAGSMPPGARVKIPLVALGDGDDKPDRLVLYAVQVIGKQPFIPYTSDPLPSEAQPGDAKPSDSKPGEEKKDPK